MIKRKLSEEERLALERAAAAERSEWGLPPSYTFARFLERWITFVTQVESGVYADHVAEYSTELEVRDSLSSMVATLPNPLRGEIELLLDAWDSRFRFATRETARPILPTEDGAGFWWYRLPKLLHGELLSSALSWDLL